jgi:hypothetical protein
MGTLEEKRLFASITIVLIVILAVALVTVKIFKEYERGVVFRLGRLVSFRGPGISFVIPFIEKMVRVDLRTLLASETFKKRQKEAARREKQQKKAARRLERRNEKPRNETKISGTNPNIPESVSRRGPTIL